jgi:hypothetical protein
MEWHGLRTEFRGVRLSNTAHTEREARARLARAMGEFREKVDALREAVGGD